MRVACGRYLNTEAGCDTDESPPEVTPSCFFQVLIQVRVRKRSPCLASSQCGPSGCWFSPGEQIGPSGGKFMHSESPFRSARCSPISVHEVRPSRRWRRNASANTAAWLTTSPTGWTVGKPSIIFCRSITIRAVVVSSFVSGIVFSPVVIFSARRMSDLARFEERFPFLFIQLCNGLRQPCTALHPWPLPHGGSLAVSARYSPGGRICRMQVCVRRCPFPQVPRWWFPIDCGFIRSARPVRRSLRAHL